VGFLRRYWTSAHSSSAFLTRRRLNESLSLESARRQRRMIHCRPDRSHVEEKKRTIKVATMELTMDSQFRARKSSMWVIMRGMPMSHKSANAVRLAGFHGDCLPRKGPSTTANVKLFRRRPQGGDPGGRRPE